MRVRLGVISHASDQVIVMKEGRVVESGSATELFIHPQHDYTKALLSAVPAVIARG